MIFKPNFRTFTDATHTNTKNFYETFQMAFLFITGYLLCPAA